MTNVSPTTLRALESDINSLSKQQADYEAQAARITADPRLAAAAKAADLRVLSDQADEALIAARTEAMQRLDGAWEQLDDEEDAVRRAARLEPQTAEEWSTANARAPFIREDIELWAASNPGAIAREYRRAAKAGDRVTAFLLARYAPAALEIAEAHVLDRQALSEAVAIAEAPDEKRLAEIDGVRARLAEMRTQFHGLRSPRERAEFGAVYGVKV